MSSIDLSTVICEKIATFSQPKHPMYMFHYEQTEAVMDDNEVVHLETSFYRIIARVLCAGETPSADAGMNSVQLQLLEKLHIPVRVPWMVCGRAFAMALKYGYITQAVIDTLYDSQHPMGIVSDPDNMYFRRLSASTGCQYRVYRIERLA